MGTRSTINIQNADGTVTSMYCHWDGYISHHGPLLLNHYNTEKKVRALLELRSLSVLGETIGRKHSFDKEHPRGEPRPCTSHFRDRGDEVELYHGPIEKVDTQEYNYLFRDGSWLVSEDGLSNLVALVPEVVAEALIK